MPHVAVMVEVVHGGLQGWLEGVWVVLKQPKHDAPHQGGEEGEGITFGLGYVAFLNSQAGQGKKDP